MLAYRDDKRRMRVPTGYANRKRLQMTCLHCRRSLEFFLFAFVAFASFAVAQPQTLPAPTLENPQPCPEQPGFTCSVLRVPLDHSGASPGTLELAVATADNVDAPRGVLLLLTGGPGQPGVSLLGRVVEYLEPDVLGAYRLVVLDQRGTGVGAIDCRELQEAVGGSDFRRPPDEAVDACAAQLGPTRDFYGTPDTVADLERLRQALGADEWVLDGISYGTFTAEHYALAHPERVGALVLDSVVPHTGFDPLGLEGMRDTARVLQAACATEPACTTDPAEDLAWLVRHGRVAGEPLDATLLLDSLAILSLNSVDPTFSGISAMLRAAREGDTEGLAGFLGNFTGFTPATDLSAGLHITTFCADLRFPWGDAAAPLGGRDEALERVLAALKPADFWPYDLGTARATLPISGCLRWPPSKPSQFSDRGRLRAPTLLLHGDRDLFCPVVWARQEAEVAVQGRLVVVSGSGHGVQGSRTDPTGRLEVAEFLLNL